MIDNLPVDLVEYLSSQKQPKYDPKACEAGKVVLRPIEKLEEFLVPTDIDNTEFNLDGEIVYGHKSDPNYKKMGCYLVPAINLIESCDDYDPFGLLLWLPEEKLYGIWDSSHTQLKIFKKALTWNEITANFFEVINSGWEENQYHLEIYIPWPKCKYCEKQIYKPITTNR